MFNFNDAYIPITLDEIKSKITDYDIFKRYCLNFEEIDRSFLSEFYNDTKTSCRIQVSATGSLYYKDYGVNHNNYFTAFNYVKYKYNCSNIHEVINILANDFGLKKVRLNMDPKLLTANNLEDEKPIFVKKKTNINIIIQPYNSIDAEYWKSYGINLETLIKFNVFSCSHIFIEKAGNHYLIEYKKFNPLYAYKFNNFYKIYRPLGTKEEKWLTNVGSDILQGYNELPEKGELLIITKSMKDVLAYHELGYLAVALQAETNILDDITFYDLEMRFDKIIINFDNDQEGIKATKRISEQYNLKYFFIKGAKDLSDLIKLQGIELTKQYINKILK